MFIHSGGNNEPITIRTIAIFRATSRQRRLLVGSIVAQLYSAPLECQRLTKTLAGFLQRGPSFNSLCCYFLQQLALQHSLPLQQLCFGGVAAVAVPISAARLRIKRRYFINSPVEFCGKTRPRDEHRAPNRRLRECGSRRRDRRTLEANNRALVVYRNRAAQLGLCRKSVWIAEIEEQARGRASAAWGRTRRCSAGIKWTANARVHVHVRATGFLLGRWKRLAWKNRSKRSETDREYGE